MNYAHSSHWTAVPDPAIPHVLPGWGPYGEGIEHHVEIGDMLVRNVSTDIRRGLDVEPKGNSIFVFEAAGLCIGHLGHLHHEPDDMQYAALGRLDVVMAAVDGGRTLDVPSMVRVMKRLRSSVIIPMHWFDGYSLNFFLTEMKEEFDIERGEGSTMTVSVRSLPDRPTVYVLSPELLFDPRP
jgi:L-ascorbate metabolism protein UlaG (beta-lactamase superfamily)